ncbi:MAG: sodium-dependent transporter [Planctomycetota bacterium]
MAESPLLEEQRENWGSRAGFILAAIGSAVGLGNLWGFPYKVHAHGGGAFLIPYLLAMIVIGIPLMILEFSLGHMTQRAAPDAYRGINRKTEPVGWWGILLGFVIITYYPVVLAWCGGYLIECLKSIFTGSTLPWAGEGLEGVEKAKNFLHHGYLHRWTDAEVASGHRSWDFGRLVGPIVLSLAAIWALMYLCIFRGVRLVGKVVLWTVPVPWIMLMILTIRGLTLPGAAQGLNFYLAPDWKMLTQPETWRWAFGQMFFSMSLAFGVMITYASFLHRKSDINNNAAIIGVADVATSFVAGVAVFSTLGAMAFITAQAGTPVPVEKVVDSGPGLAFVAFPYALAQLPGAAWFGAVFFIALLLLGIDSAFSITESVLASLVDKTGWKRSWTLIGLTVVGFGLGLVYCTRGGLAWLGGIDDFINSSWGGIALLGLLEAVVVGWSYRIGRLREHANERSDWRLGVWWDWLIRYVAPLVLSGLFTWSLLEKFTGGRFLYDADGTLIVPTLAGLIVAIAMPLLAMVLSLIRSPGANAHAAHVGQPRHGRGVGIAGTVLVAGGLAVLVYAFRLIGLHPAEKFDMWLVAGLLPASWLAPLAGVLATGATVLGSGVVWTAETGHRRPSGFARLSGGLGIMTAGAAGGFWMGSYLLTHPAAEAAAMRQPREAAELAGAGYAVLAIMVTLLVLGLGWCFYRAMKAAGGPEAPQYPDDQGDLVEEGE